ncbi:hypothetical protein H744_2c0801 [Photobacterium gaetbulicola Gung47]|uniref:DUF1107 domain-containing protein n=2 Tax=Vibrionaceae TaxID=641 RepID=A0A0C5WK33_9GAMM|nr:hypothetical protein H744_2c0801 [Photobacterium gaetbulicola Gung47]
MLKASQKHHAHCFIILAVKNKRKGWLTMRMFKRYVPKMIAKHVSRLFSGRIYIDGRGGYEFNNGLLLVPVKAQQRHYQTVNEINQEIRRLKDC